MREYQKSLGATESSVSSTIDGVEITSPNPDLSLESPSSIVNPWQQNASCDPFTPESSPCLLGNYVSYSIKVTSWQDVVAGIRFAQKKNIRLVVKNTGHE